jgi:hypothetical protein
LRSNLLRFDNLAVEAASFSTDKSVICAQLDIYSQTFLFQYAIITQINPTQGLLNDPSLLGIGGLICVDVRQLFSGNLLLC